MTSIFSQIEDDLNILANGRRSQFVEKWKTTSIFSQIEYNFKFWQMEGNRHILEMEDNLNILVNGR